MRTARYGGAWPPCTELNGGLACIHLCICGNQQLSTQHPNCRAYCQFSTLFDPCWHDITFCNLIDDPSTKRPTSTNEPRQPTKTNSGQQCASNRAANAFSRRGRRNIQGFFNIPNLCTEGNHNVITFVTGEEAETYSPLSTRPLGHVHSILDGACAENATPELEFADLAENLLQKTLELELGHFH